MLVDPTKCKHVYDLEAAEQEKKIARENAIKSIKEKFNPTPNFHNYLRVLNHQAAPSGNLELDSLCYLFNEISEKCPKNEM